MPPPLAMTQGPTIKLLFLDDRHIDQAQGLVRRFGQPEPCKANPIIRADRPWERDAAFVDTGLVFYDEADQLFKAWYQGGACYGPNDQSNMCYATSVDGIEWNKPDLGVVKYEGNTRNNIVLMADCMMHDPAVILDHADPDPARRYKAIWWGGRCDPAGRDGWQLGHAVGFSPDGIHWAEHPNNPVWPADAEVAIPFDIERRKGPLMMFCSADGHGMRVVARTQSEDWVNWDLPPELVFGSTDDDPPGTEMGGLAAIDYFGTPIGLLWVIHNLPEFETDQWQNIVQRNIRQGYLGPPITMNKARCRLIFTELVTANNTHDWRRIQHKPFLALGGAGSWDECLSLGGRPIVVRDQIYIYYTGMGRTMQTPGVQEPQIVGQWNIETGLATLRLDGWAYLETQESSATLLTCPFELKDTQLRINADATNGRISGEILDEQGHPIPGYERVASHLVTGDQLRATLRWKGKQDLAELRGRTLRLRLELEDASLFSVQIA